jgi:hypothetical protein
LTLQRFLEKSNETGFIAFFIYEKKRIKSALVVQAIMFRNGVSKTAINVSGVPIVAIVLSSGMRQYH